VKLERVRKDVHRLLDRYPRAKRIFAKFESDQEVAELQFLANNFTVKRLGYNDHGRVHAYVVARNALKLLEVVREAGIPLNVVEEGIGDVEDSVTIVSVGAFLHDIGNSIHRGRHGTLGAILANPILDRHLRDEKNYLVLKTRILEVIYSHNDDVAVSTEASIVKVADGTDMTKGRARIPYEMGRFDIHSVSALSINDVEIEKGKERPIRIVVDAEHTAALFQVEMVLGEKIKSSRLKGLVEVVMRIPSVGEKVLFF
jgi:metal-dependent HD superfamily phosphatase/phosphodiesterase